MVSSGGWLAVTPRVLRRVGAPETVRQRVLAEVLDVGGDAVLSHTAAASLWGLPGFSLRPTTVARARTHAPRRGAVVHLVRDLPSRWLTTLDAIPVVRPELCVLQLCATVHRGKAERALDTAWSLRLLSGRSVAALLADMGERGRNGTALLRELLDARGFDYTPPASNLESRFQRVLADRGLPEMRRQVDSGGDSWTGRVDFRDEFLPLIVEVQSERYHTALVDRLADARRLAQLRADGFIVVEVLDTEVWERPQPMVERIRAARARAAQVLRTG